MSSSIPGNPAEMRARAARVRSQADEILAWAGRIGGKVDDMEFEGRAARRIRHQTKLSKDELLRAGHGLIKVAELLRRSAAEVEARQVAARALQAD